MRQDADQLNYLYSSIVELLAIAMVFFISCSLLSLSNQAMIVQKVLICACVVSASLYVSGRFLDVLKSKNKSALHIVYKNAVGLLLAVTVLLCLSQIYGLEILSIAEVVLGSLGSFFVLSTLNPLLDRDISNFPN